MDQNNHLHQPCPPAHVNVVPGPGYVPLTQASVVGSSMPAQGQLGHGMPAIWQGWQPHAIVGSSMPQSMPVVPQMWTPPGLGQYQLIGQPGARDIAANSFAGALTQRLLQPMHGGLREDLSPVQLSPDDERILVQALKAGLAGGLTPRQILERLQAVRVAIIGVLR